MTAITAYAIRATAQLTRDEVARLWGWLQDNHRANFDDYGPVTIDELYEILRERTSVGTVFHVVETPECGMVGVFGMNVEKGVAHFDGLSFDPRFHGKGIAHQTVEHVLTDYFNQGVRKVAAVVFSSNLRALRFFERLGFRVEGVLEQATLQNGQPIGMTQLALFAARKGEK